MLKRIIAYVTADPNGDKITHTHTSLYWASFLGSQHDAARICCWAQASTEYVDRQLHALRQHPAANQPHAAAAVDRRDRQTDGLTPDRYI